MSKVRTVTNSNRVTFFCPGCKNAHQISVSPPHPCWTWNGSMDSPTFTPSIKVTKFWSETGTGREDSVCHSFVTVGRVQFLGDCTHKLAGQTVEIPEWPYAPGAFGGIDEPAA